MYLSAYSAVKLTVDHECQQCRVVASRRLVPGDIVVLLKGKATADMVLLQGNCLVDESVLSGEVFIHHMCHLLRQIVCADCV